MTSSQIIVVAVTIFLIVAAIEFVIGRRRGNDTYRLNNIMCNIGVGATAQVVALFTRLFTAGVHAVVLAHFSLWKLPTKPWVWLVGLFVYDFLFYCHHRCAHRVALIWAGCWASTANSCQVPGTPSRT